jgi:hypothetical protein
MNIAESCSEALLAYLATVAEPTAALLTTMSMLPPTPHDLLYAALDGLERA